jgi:hypothetical protein
VEFSASPASVERALFGDPNHSYGNQGDRDHPMDPPHLSEKGKSGRVNWIPVIPSN